MSAKQIVEAKWPDAFISIHECDEGCKHYRVIRPRQILGMYENSEAEAWENAAKRIKEQE